MIGDTSPFRDTGLSGQTVSQGDATAPPETDCFNEADPVHERAEDNQADSGVEDFLDASPPFGDAGVFQADGGMNECETDAEPQTRIEGIPDCPEPPTADEPNCDEDAPTVGE